MQTLDDAWIWLRDTALPFWLDRGVDWDRGGFHECLELGSARCPADFRRLRVATRQVFAFAAAHGAGLARAGEAVETGITFLRRARGTDGGYPWRYGLDGTVLDGRRDLYDHAFVLLALSAAARVLPAEPLRREALALLDFLDGHMAHPAGGYAEGLPATLPRRQNPHMHLLEACLAAFESFGEAVFLDRATALARLFLDRLLDPATGALPEFYGDDLRPVLQDGRFAWEPGHHAEWAWLLDWHRRLAGPLEGDPAARLLAVLDRQGLRQGAAVDAVWSDGAVKEAGFRLWPQTERLKAEALRPDRTAAGQAGAVAALARHIAGAPPGLWFERLDPSGRPLDEPAPASSLYHLTAGILVARAAKPAMEPGLSGRVG
ncbi:AGE family epimerase/isomerase [Pararoseomonas indoligenes]|uniref:AGE family epimerase/isomerase n=1 Tax=Roseomonas indoligenes TaxID=2820811 RepID=A0A940N1Q6_9PROT|nr:AGE family epimerase/isomerase [Pararoseomonas indoligenes]MBP0495638.1 AGE family epimerase/isomerase [Pararoseomonas indoligenes]